jgi:hypothetical protein
MWADRAASAAQPETKVRGLSHWLDTLLGKVPLAQVPPQTARLASAVRDGQFAACERTAVIVVLAATMLADPLTQTEAETLTGLKIPAHSTAESDHDGSLLAALLALAAARRGDVTACRNSIALLASEQLSQVVRLAWSKAMVEAMDELPASQISQWSDIARRIPWDDDSERVPALKVIGLRLQMLGGRDAARDSALEGIKQTADQHPRDPHLQLVYAAALAQSDPERFADAVAILKRVALGTSKNSESYLRARWLEIRWRVGRGETRAAAQIAALTLSSHAIEPAWWEARFEAVAQQSEH